MYKFIIYILPVVVAISPTFAEEEISLPIQTTPKAINLQIQEEIESPLTKKNDLQLLDVLDHHWIHQLSNINENDHQIMLEDGSTWEIGWWWHFRVQNWDQADTIVLTFDKGSVFNRVKIRNVSKGSTAWGNLYSSPQVDSPNLQWVQSVEDHFSTIVLNDGCRVKSSHPGIFKDWKEEDIVITARVEGKKTPYALWNVFTWTIVWNLTIDD
ncbi:MAG: hypothetical protein K940chlam7_01008 [Chlamydiae bacterium]|nr:hypothetical protein [Chlamydiota bacterium]